MSFENYGYLIIDDLYFQPTEKQQLIKQICIPRSVYDKIIKDNKNIRK